MTQPKALIAERYRLIESLGAGGMGRVWLARDEMLRRDVAIKEVILPEGLTAEEREELRLRTLREARAAARLNDPNVVRIYDVIQSEQAPWIVMEYVPSRSLHQVITDEGPLPPERVAQIGLAVLSALRAAHAAGVLHRDVKPGNVLLADTGRVVLTDFGLAVFEGGDGAVTRPGLILGSPQYISPERAREGTSGPESDMWSLGATLYAAVEGRSPYARSTTFATLTALATEDPDPPTRAGVMKPVLNALLRKDPRARAGVAETERLLQRAAAGEGRGFPWSLPALPSLPRPRRSREGHSGSSSVRSRSSEPVAPVSAPPDGASDHSPVPFDVRPEARVEFPGRARGSAVVGPPPSPVVSSGASGGASGVVFVEDDDDSTVPAGQRWKWIAAGAAAVVLAVVAVIVLSDEGSSPPAEPPVTGQAARPTSAAPSPSPSVSLSPQVQGSFGPDVMQLPPGYHYESDPKWGWTVAVPDGWIKTPHETSESMVYFVSNTDPRIRMGVDTTFTPPPDAVADWEQQERARLRNGLYPNYVRVGINPVTNFHGQCADWQWTYDSSQGGRLHVSNLGCRVRDNLGHALYWQAPDSLWDTEPVTTMYGIIKVSFRPKPA
ncbi:serine/threonine-protein kinase [Dactylosporangium sp. AC04546]|uniref:serine/threonine-protein kinase n=1 Tax=Dactylosporangium sp. AC04546 TaxID=2862460 RepID=UPI001EE01EBC|nr:serine/threonine-protein kinase [Dactylosporangium sp. AC04546]WVK84775.1 serine/threonine-protein kinase [Dactylosporangium sp. AC04546]